MLGQPLVQLRAAALRRVVGGEVTRAAGALVVLRVLLHPVERELPGPRTGEDLGVEVGCVDPRALVQALFLEEDRERVRLLPGGAAGIPDADEGVGAQERDDVLAER